MKNRIIVKIGFPQSFLGFLLKCRSNSNFVKKREKILQVVVNQRDAKNNAKKAIRDISIFQFRVKKGRNLFSKFVFVRKKDLSR